MKFTKLKKPAFQTFILIALMLIFYVVPVMAAGGETIPVDSGVLGGTDKTALSNTLKNIIMGVGYFIGIVAVGALVYNGFKIAISTNEQKRMEAKTHLFWALGGVVLVALSFMLVDVVVNLVAGK